MRVEPSRFTQDGYGRPIDIWPPVWYFDATCSGDAYVMDLGPVQWAHRALVMDVTALVPDFSQAAFNPVGYDGNTSREQCVALPPNLYYRPAAGQCVGSHICGGSPNLRPAKAIDLSGFVPPFTLR